MMEAKFWSIANGGGDCWALVLRGQTVKQVRGRDVRRRPAELLAWCTPGMPRWIRVAEVVHQRIGASAPGTEARAN